MEYNELKSKLTANKKKIKDAAELTGYAENSFRVAYLDGTMSYTKVPLLCKLADITPNEFFGWEELANGSGNFASHISGGNTQNSNESIRALREQLKEKDKQISRLLTLLEKAGTKAEEDYGFMAAETTVKKGRGKK